MKATIERATLLKALSHVQSVVERRNTIPILSNVLLEASEDGGLRLMATDLDIQINETVAAQVSQPGATTVSAHTLFDIARKLPEGSQVELTAAEGIVSSKRLYNQTRVVQTSAPISQGSSGGGLFDARGHLLGITTFYFRAGQNLSFAVAAEEYAQEREESANR